VGRSRGGPLSSAILYFAIVAIWAGVLMPKWLRPSQTHRRRADMYQREEAGHTQPGSVGEHFHVDPAPHERVSREPERYEAGRYEAVSYESGHDEDGRRITGRYEADLYEAGYQAGLSEAGRHEAEPAPAAPATAGPGEAAAAQGDPGAAAQGGPGGQQAADGTPLDPAEQRANILRSRRRMLGTLIALTLGAVVLGLTHFAETWIIIPPAVMLAGFLVLLREAARSDRERARRLAHAGPMARGREAAGFQRVVDPATAGDGEEAAPAAAEADREAAAAAASGDRGAAGSGREDAETGQVSAEGGGVTTRGGRAADADRQAEPLAAEQAGGAKIIDFSARLTDQLYDQYTDAAERAIGD
jgi:hypothetical protein